MTLFEEAKLFFDKAYKLNPNDKLIVEHQGDALYKTGQKTEAVELWIKAKELGSTNKMIDKKIDKKEFYEPVY